jgi:hypothetical protein
MLGIKGRNGSAPIPKPLEEKEERTHSVRYALLRSQEPLPPYELDPSPHLCNRVGELIAKAMQEPFSER